MNSSGSTLHSLKGASERLTSRWLSNPTQQASFSWLFASRRNPGCKELCQKYRRGKTSWEGMLNTPPWWGRRSIAVTRSYCTATGRIRILLQQAVLPAAQNRRPPRPGKILTRQQLQGRSLGRQPLNLRLQAKGGCSSDRRGCIARSVEELTMAGEQKRLPCGLRERNVSQSKPRTH